MISNSARLTDSVEFNDDNPRSEAHIDRGTRFSREVLIIPALTGGLEHALRERDGRYPVASKRHVPVGEWINRGDPLLSIEVPFGWAGSIFRPFKQQEEPKLVPIYSPVSGLVLEMHPRMAPRAHILMANNQPPPLSAGDVFGELCDFLSANRVKIFHKPKRLRGQRAYTDENLNNLLAELLSSPISIEDAWALDAGGHKSMQYICLEELIAKRPDLALQFPPQGGSV